MAQVIKFLGWLVKEKKITPHIPVWEKSDRKDGIFSRSDFHSDRKRGAYVCPNGKLLQTSRTVHDGRTLLYRASKRDCDVCPIRAKCCTTADARKIPRDLHEDARDVARRKMKTKAFARSRDERKRIEMRFAHLKTHHGFERMRLRGLSGARDEFHLAAIVQNLKTIALRMLGTPPHTTIGLDIAKSGFSGPRRMPFGQNAPGDGSVCGRSAFSRSMVISGRNPARPDRAQFLWYRDGCYTTVGSIWHDQRAAAVTLVAICRPPTSVKREQPLSEGSGALFGELSGRTNPRIVSLPLVDLTARGAS